MSTTAAIAPWEDVMAGLRGRRLAIYDDILRYGAHQVDWEWVSVNHAEDVEWLANHRFITRDELDTWRARPVKEARRIYEEKGPANPAEARQVPEPIEPARYQEAMVARQGEFFT